MFNYILGFCLKFFNFIILDMNHCDFLHGEHNKLVGGCVIVLSGWYITILMGVQSRIYWSWQRLLLSLIFLLLQLSVFPIYLKAFNVLQHSSMRTFSNTNKTEGWFSVPSKHVIAGRLSKCPILSYCFIWLTSSFFFIPSPIAHIVHVYWRMWGRSRGL